MRLKTIIVDAFKSYAHRQELDNLDSHFNAITGLNGSGKSNIFDAICFVMGISNLKKVRAEDPSELIFKNGQAGIQRASVTIEFLNNDPRTAPEGYPPQDFPIITVGRAIQTGGRQRFFLCGKAADQPKVKSFFHSVGMNVDNPHFMVLQGTVHKLVNMRPADILGWLEEAAGTKIFDMKRRSAENMFAAKVKKLEMLETDGKELHSRLTSMLSEQEEYAKYVKIAEGLEEKRKFRLAHTYWKHCQSLVSNSTSVNSLRERGLTARSTLQALPEKKAELQRRAEEIQSNQSGPLEQMKVFENQLAEAKKQQAKIRTERQQIAKQLTNQQKMLQKVKSDAEETKKQLEKFLSTSQISRDAYNNLQTELSELSESIDKYKESIRLLKSGVKAGAGGMSLPQEIQMHSRELTKLQGELKRVSADLKHATAEMQELRHSVSSESDELAARQAALAAAEADVQRAEKVAQEKGYDTVLQQVSELEDKLDQKNNDMQRAMIQLRDARGPFPPLQYDPIPGEDVESAIFGRVAELLKVKEETHSLALSQGAGIGTLARVVITDDRIAQLLIERGRLQTRTSFLPLSKITSKGPPIDEAKAKEAQRIAAESGGTAHVAIDLIEYDPKFAAVMHNFFGSFFVCSDLEVAKAVALNPRTMFKAVTLDGDVVDGAVISGGARGNIRDILKDVSRLPHNAIRAIRSEISALKNQLQKLTPVAAAAKRALDDTQQKERTIGRLREELRYRESNSATARCEQISQQVIKLQDDEAGIKHKIAAIQQRKSECENELANNDTDQQMQLLSRKLKEAQTRQERIMRQQQEDAAMNEQSESTKAHLDQALVDAEKDMQEKEADLAQLIREEETLKTQFDEVRQLVEQTEDGVTTARQQSSALVQEYQEVSAEINQLEEEEQTCRRIVKDTEASLRTLQKGLDDVRKTVSDLENHHAWLVTQKASLGSRDGVYYFEDEERTAATLAELADHEVLVDSMSRRVNKKATVMYDQIQGEYASLCQQRSTISTDKETILDTIRNAEEGKKVALDTMVREVSKNFSMLFQACLSHATCRLVEQRDEDTGLLKGVAVKVAFSGKEKESLSELSGGQRSLLALCLILAILRNRPAPVYILDEVDAALDPSHTQNIGKMLKEHFADAQFLLVSLKNGMFDNANVLFEIRNTQGYSQVTRRAKKDK